MRLGKTILFFILSLLAQGYIFQKFCGSCDFHVPLNKKLNWLQSIFFKIELFHPAIKFETFFLPSLTLTIMFFLILPKKDHDFGL